MVESKYDVLLKMAAKDSDPTLSTVQPKPAATADPSTPAAPPAADAPKPAPKPMWQDSSRALW